ncbi:hypothetical protein WL19_03180 [Burkholderia ubonensis]|nr:hypothetical protein WI74_31830 [Burkholderia ubonensis]KVZ58174.1 hypothetical protein WL19_03180 [Burkholderia ubonensis]KVZ78584.1 hypothetical protein WL24_22175 [Burkholderia ubonensis]
MVARCGVAYTKDLVRREERIQCSGYTCVESQLHKSFDNLRASTSYIQCPMKMHFELRRRGAKRGERRDDQELSRLYIKTRSRIDVAE